ncbi:MAG: primosomal protein N' [Desulfovibrionales bacterium]
MPQFWKVALLSAPYTCLTYAQPGDPGRESWIAGQRVLVPLGKSIRLGILLAQEPSAPELSVIKPLLWPMDRSPLVTPLQLDLAFELAKRQMRSPGLILSSFIPAPLRPKKVVFHLEEEHALQRISSTQLSQASQEERARLAGLWEKGRMIVRNPGEIKPEPVLHLNMDPPWPVRPGAVRQHRILDHLWQKGAIPRSRINSVLGEGTLQALSPLLSRGIVRMEVEQDVEQSWVSEPCTSFDLTSEQESALRSLQHALKDQDPQTRLVHGVTGSGKTLLYLRLAATCLEQGRSVLILCPEVALAIQIARIVRKEMGSRAGVLYHGYQDPNRRAGVYLRLLEEKGPSLVVGTRSALFLPLSNPGLVILDEEHDASFKQDESLVYQAKELAYHLVRKCNGLLVLGSATPDMKTTHAAEAGLIRKVELTHRVSSRPLPSVQIVDLLEHPPVNGPFSSLCTQAIHRTIAAGEQIIIMQNRRGYAPLVYCVDCGNVSRCGNCEVGLTYHRSIDRLVCHYCGLSLPFPPSCVKCGGCQFLPLGEGTERVVEHLKRDFPEQKVLRLDRDAVRRKGRMEEILQGFSRGEAQILVGTQMISKGHDFPNVTLVLVVDGDLGLNLPDYRATERTFQLLVQVSGRAGRGDKNGRVFIQTRNADHYCWSFIRSNDYSGFYRQEIQRRKKLRYPPFAKLGLVRMNFPEDWAQGLAQVNEIAAQLHKAGRKLGVSVLGPAPSPLSRLRRRVRYQCLLKADDWQSIRSAFAPVWNSQSQNSPLRIQLDLDPVNML